MIYFCQEVIEDEKKFLSAYQSLKDDIARKQVLVQYYLTNGNLPREILDYFFDKWRVECVDEPIAIAGEFDAPVDDIFFKIHYYRSDFLQLDVVSTFKNPKVNISSEKEIYLNEKIDELADYEDIFPKDIIDELRSYVRKARKKGN